MTDPIARLNAALEGRYRIEREIGQGGMATVYLADDLRHERKVALKVLKPDLAAVVGAERFLAEIKTTANLQHPHILPLHDSGEADGFLFYVMPYVEGDTVRDKIDREKQLAIEEAVKITEKVASALEYAHEHGVVHRDIKPSNILLSAKGEPTVADFGIALAVAQAGGGRVTETGLSVGTPHYMSPEQATGDRDVDPRTDIYALGCVLYEMLIGEPPYTGSTAQAILGKIIQGGAISATEARSTIPPNVDAAIRKALEKLPADRFGTAQDLVSALEDPSFRHGGVGSGLDTDALGRWKRASIGLGAVALLSTFGLAWAVLRPDPPEAVSRSVLMPPSGVRLAQGPTGIQGFAVSPDGRTVVFPDGPTGQLYRQGLDQLDAVPIPGGERAWYPFFSPDGEWVGYFNQADNTIRKIRLDGSQNQTLAPVPGGIRSAGWGADGDIILHSNGLDPVLSNGVDSGLWRVSDSGGELEHIANTEGPQLEWLDLLPGGRAVLAGVLSAADSPVEEIVAVSLETGERTTLLTGTTPRYVATGHLLFWRAGTLWAVPFDPERLELRGAPTPIADGVGADGNRLAHFAVGGDLLFYREGFASAGAPTNEFVWVTRSGQATPVDPGYTFTQGQVNVGWRLSPDETRIVFNSAVDGNDDIRIKHLPDGPEERVTFSEEAELRPFWTPDGQSVAYFLAGDIWSRRADGTGDPVLLLDEERTLTQGSWSPDGAWLVFRGAATAAQGLGLRDVLGFRPGVDTTVISLVATRQFAEQGPVVSPDGRWLAYSSDETGREEIFVRPFPNVDSTRVRISTDGGTGPLWAKSGDELFFVDQELRLVSSGFDPATGQVRATEVLFTIPAESLALAVGGNNFYDVTSDGERFLMARFVAGNTGEDPSESERFILVQNFSQGLRQVVPD